MKHTSRRSLLASTGVALALAACSAVSTTPTVPTIVSYAQLVGQAISTLATTLAAQASAAGAAPAIVSAAKTIAGYAALATTLVQEIGAAATPPPTSVAQFVSLAGQVATLILNVVPGGSSLIGLVTDIQAIAQAIAAASGIVLPAASPRTGAPLPVTSDAVADLKRRLGIVG